MVVCLQLEIVFYVIILYMLCILSLQVRATSTDCKTPLAKLYLIHVPFSMKSVTVPSYCYS